jgi:hypothetical protein
MHYPQGCGNVFAPPHTRRDFLTKCGTGFGMMGLTGLMSGEGLLPSAQAARPTSAATFNPMATRSPHFAPKAKRVIHLFMNGGPSHVDTFDPKPALDKWAGKKIPKNLKTERETGAALASPFKFKKYGQSGIPISDIFSDLGQHADDMCVIRSMHAEVPNHEPSLKLMNCGTSTMVRPSFGSWLTYGLGTENQNLPGFIAMCPGGYPISSTQNWSSAFLPGAYQGTYVNTKHSQVDRLIENIRPNKLTYKQQRKVLDLVQKLNQQHLDQRGKDPALEARIHSYELAYRMQMEATDAFDISKEPAKVRERYGNTVQAKQILIARRLIERGVRFVQLYHGDGQPWDNHDNIASGHRNLAGQCSKAIAALLTDLKEKGLLDETLVLWGGEFGRTPTVELPKPGANAGKVNGRDHNHWGFSVWMAGGGIKGGTVYGATDEFGFQAAENPVHVHDLHATMLHLLGFNHEKLTYRYAGRDYRLTDVHGKVVKDILA